MAIRKKTSKTSRPVRRKTRPAAAKAKSHQSPVPFLVFGTLFGYFLSKSRATDYDSIVDMFLCRDFQLYGVILVAIAATAWGLYWMRQSSKAAPGKPFQRDPVLWVAVLWLLPLVLLGRTQDYSWVHKLLVPAILVEAALGLYLVCRRVPSAAFTVSMDFEPLKFDPSRLLGALLFGAGWALAGTCPGTSLAQIGEGKLVAFATVLGIAAGVWAYKKFKPGAAQDSQVC